MMKKTTALALFGGSYSQLAQALGCTVKAIGEWPNDPAPLPRLVADRVIAAKVRENVRRAREHAAITQQTFELDPLETDAISLE